MFSQNPCEIFLVFFIKCEFGFSEQPSCICHKPDVTSLVLCVSRRPSDPTTSYYAYLMK